MNKSIAFVESLKKDIERYESDIVDKKLSDESVTILLKSLNLINGILSYEAKKLLTTENAGTAFDYSLGGIMDITIITLKSLDIKDNNSFFITCYHGLMDELNYLITQYNSDSEKL